MNIMRVFPACLLFLAPLGLLGSIPELSLNKAEEGKLTPGVPVSCSIALNAGDYADISIKLNQSSALAQIFDSADTKVRAANLEDAAHIAFVAPTAGRYRIELLPKTPGNYSITWQDKISLEQRVAPTPQPPRLEGPRIKALRAALASGEANAVPAFWDEMKARGVPLIEPLEGHPNERLATFLWHGNADTRRVLLMWRWLMMTAPEKCSLSQLEKTNVWFATFKMNSAKLLRYRYVENGPDLPTDDNPTSGKNMRVLWSLSEIDPLNPKRVEAADTQADVDRFHGSSVLEMPDAPPEPWLQRREGVASGAISTGTIHSTLLGNDRTVKVYRPPGYKSDGKPYAVIYMMDGDKYLDDISIGRVLDNLLSEHRIPPFVAVLINNAPGARGAELGGNPVFADFMATELVPWAHRSYNVTSDPRRVVIGGLSAGGIAAAYTAFRHPDVFGNVLSQSGSFWWHPPQKGPNGHPSDPGPPWMASQFLESPRLPIRFSLSAGTDEIDPSGGGGVILIPNRELRDVLLAKGYQVFYREVDGEHDTLNWRPIFPEALLLLAKGMDEAKPAPGSE